MKRWFLFLVMGGILTGWAELANAEKVTLALKYPMGRTAEYKNKYRFEYYSNQAEQIVSQSGSMRVIVENEWRSNETVTQVEALQDEVIEENNYEEKNRYQAKKFKKYRR